MVRPTRTPIAAHSSGHTPTIDNVLSGRPARRRHWSHIGASTVHSAARDGCEFAGPGLAWPHPAVPTAMGSGRRMARSPHAASSTSAGPGTARFRGRAARGGGQSPPCGWRRNERPTRIQAPEFALKCPRSCRTEHTRYGPWWGPAGTEVVGRRSFRLPPQLMPAACITLVRRDKAEAPRQGNIVHGWTMKPSDRLNGLVYNSWASSGRTARMVPPMT